MFVDDDTRLLHMMDAAREALGFVAGKTRADLDADRQLAMSLVKCIEIIGEAAAKVTPATRGKYPKIPWPAMVGMRNRLIHSYWEIDLDRVWDTVTHNLPELVSLLDRKLPPHS